MFRLILFPTLVTAVDQNRGVVPELIFFGISVQNRFFPKTPRRSFVNGVIVLNLELDRMAAFAALRLWDTTRDL